MKPGADIGYSSKNSFYTQGVEKSKHLTITLAGNANAGKSVVFNELTGSNQIIETCLKNHRKGRR